VGFENANRTNGLLSTWSVLQLPLRHRKRGIAAKRHKKRKKKITVLATPVIPRARIRLICKAPLGPPRFSHSLFCAFCAFLRLFLRSRRFRRSRRY
jgi:hypothetical protein